MFGYEDATYTLAVEQFMQRYYRTVMDRAAAQRNAAAALPRGDPGRRERRTVALSRQFQERDGYLEVTGDDVVRCATRRHCSSCSSCCSRHPALAACAPTRSASSRQSLWLIDEEFRQNPRNHRLFLEILRRASRRHARTAAHESLRRARPLHPRLRPHRRAHAVRPVPRLHGRCAHAVRGQQPAALCARTLRPRVPEAAADLSARCRNPELAYLAALFHDIAKGRGGDHSELGAVDAEAFCLEQGLSRYDARLVAWLVRNHLLLSVTAQKQDIADPQVINALRARASATRPTSTTCTLLTVADVRGTNPKLWNSWKATLFDELLRARQARAPPRPREPDRPRGTRCRDAGAGARSCCATRRRRSAAIDASGHRCTDTYFLRHSAAEIAWHTGELAARDPADASPLVAVAEHPEPRRRDRRAGATRRGRRHSFARTTAALDQMGLSIQDARITPTHDDASLDTYLVLEDTGMPITDASAWRDRAQLARALSDRNAATPAVTRRMPRQARMFTTPTQVDIHATTRRMSVPSSSSSPAIARAAVRDRPGLLWDSASTCARRARS